MIKYIYRSKFIADERGFAFTATATVISVILGLTLLFMVNTVRTESVRVSELKSGQDAYWEAMADVQMVADMININGIGILPFIDTYFPNITITTIDQNNIVVSSQVSIGNTRGGAHRAASIRLVGVFYSIIETVGHGGPFKITGFSEIDGGNLYIGGNVEIPSFWGSPLARVGQDSMINFFIPDKKTFDPAIGEGGNNYTVTNIKKLKVPGFDHTAYNSLLSIAGAIGVTNPGIGEYKDKKTTLDNISHPAGIDLQDVNFTNGGIFVNGDLTIDGTAIAGTSIINNNTAASPGFIVVDGKVTLKGDWFLLVPTFRVPDNIIIIASKDVKLEYVNFGGSVSYPTDTWSNYVNEIYTRKKLETKKWSFSSEMFGQFYVFNKKKVGWTSRTSGLIYTPDASFDFEKLISAFPRFDGTFFVKRASDDEIAWAHDEISWAADINFDENPLGRGLAGGLIQSATNLWMILPGTIQEI